ncbi:MAG: tetratricopeptide repeat protein [Bacteroidetes bacterium]|uniref:Tetratricopeptide repeat protein n=1 Tax=Candidatus Cryptobacteroides merdavium TaxID=2840769 RepID=A0A9D9HBZ3_9BACT|nr:tetratricopeptide repeat protein [Candidatus Cryptobacteroides merdavium]
MKNILVCIMLALVTVAASAQPDRKDVRRGNRDFKKEDWKAAEIDYRKALVKDSSSVAANYNLGNTLYRMGDMEQARKSYDALKEVAPSSAAASDLYYNMGNAASQAKDWQAAVDAYKESLLRNPGDMDAKENYIYAKEMLKNQQNQDQNGGNQNQDNQQDQQNQDDKNQNNQDNKDNQDKNDDQNKDQQNDGNNQDQQDSPQQPQQGQQPKITPQAAQQMLQAIQEKEKETQEKVKKEKAEALKSRQKEKNW